MELYKLSAIGLRNIFFKKNISAKEIVKYFINRIEKKDEKLKSIISLLKNRAEKKADILDKKISKNEPLGKLAGIPIIVKDNINIKNEITTCGSKFLKNYRSLFDASVIKFLDEEDAIIIAKSNLDEFAMGSSNEHSAFFKTCNPWNLKCVPGGSSGGSAAAVAARLSPISIGSDTGGSIRQPAAFCGIVGFKPTYGRVSRYGLVAFASSLDQIGPMATNVMDMALTMEVLENRCFKDSTNLRLPFENYTSNLLESLEGLKIGVPWDIFKNVDQNIYNNFKNSIEVLKSLKAEIISVELNILKYSTNVYYILSPAEAATNLARFDGIKYGVRSKGKTLDDIYDLSRDEGFGEEVKRRIMLGTFILSSGFKYYQKAQKVRTLIIRDFEETFKKCDLIALPTTPSSAFKIDSIKDPVTMYLQDSFTIPANMAGLPAISVPSGFDEQRKPLGIQFMGPQLHDALVIKAGYAFEREVKYSFMIPPIFDEE
ncbi:MAG: glutamyl-tRNA amidotransferase [Chlamydiae bacterium SM23_39]|nr:MAG: glutamyl-tRNA amidotransferase [Chlamydiae bacterium SM23_39]